MISSRTIANSAAISAIVGREFVFRWNSLSNKRAIFKLPLLSKCCLSTWYALCACSHLLIRLINLSNRSILSTIDQISKLNGGKVVNLICIVLKCSEIAKLISEKTGKKLLKQELMLIDHTGQFVLSLCKNQTKKFVFQKNLIVCLQRAKVCSFIGKN